MSAGFDYELATLRSAERGGDMSAFDARCLSAWTRELRPRVEAVLALRTKSPFDSRVDVLLRYRRLRNVGTPVPDCIAILQREFATAVPANVVEHLARGKGLYAAERARAKEFSKAELLP